MKKLTIEHKRILTEYIGEEWYDPPRGWNTYNRSYSPDAWDSLGKLKEKIVEKGKWHDFWKFTKDMHTRIMKERNCVVWKKSDHDYWLFQPANFFPLVVAAIEGGII